MTTDYEFIKTNAADIEADMIAMYEELTKTTVQPASPEKLFIQWVASVIVKAYVTMNYIGNQNIPSRASGENLDALGEMFFSVDRPQAQAALATERFTLSEAADHDIIVPIGTRVTDASRSIFFETAVQAVIPAGETTVDVQIRCAEPGTIGNGYASGQLNTIVDVFEYYKSCTNTTTTDGGSNEATDAEYLNLLKASMDAYSTAGPIGAYKYHAMKVSTEIADVKVIRPKESIVSDIRTVYAGHAFLCGTGIALDTLYIEDGEKDTDYTVSCYNGLIDIALIEGGTLEDAEEIETQYVREKAGEIEIYALMKDGTAASSTIKDLILEACNDSTVRPLTDTVSVKNPQTKSCNIAFTYYRSYDCPASSAEVAAAVAAAVEEYKAWQTAKLGRDLNPSKLVQLVMGTGLVKRVAVTSPAFEVLKDGTDHTAPTLAVIGTTTITDGGLEDE